MSSRTWQYLLDHASHTASNSLYVLYSGPVSRLLLPFVGSFAEMRRLGANLILVCQPPLQTLITAFNSMSDPNVIAKSFVDFYYASFDRNRAELAPLYKEGSMLSFEGQQYAGSAIVQKLVELPFQTVRHQVVTIDAQPSNPSAGPLLVTVTGRLLVDEEQNPMHFSQTFQLVPEGTSYYIFNDIFRLNYGF
ncbi:hypothetical protein BASA83_006798 [Batrachochytrium salamandrivorans]|nr:hypothetical protein BASA83_006798 [Batrachochytrium salamandrivorans]